MVYFVRNKVNMGVIGKPSRGNAGFYDRIRIYCMWKAVRHVLTLFSLPVKHNKLHTYTRYMVFFMSYEYDTNPESAFSFFLTCTRFYKV